MIGFSSHSRQISASAGFTLIELILFMALSSLLLAFVLRGWSTLQQRARFDAAVNQTIQNFAYARNFALSNVNTQGSGSNTDSLLVGVALEFDNQHYWPKSASYAGDPNAGKTFPMEELEPIYASPDVSGSGYFDASSYRQVPGDPSNPAETINSCNLAEAPLDPPYDNATPPNIIGGGECWESFLGLAEPLAVSIQPSPLPAGWKPARPSLSDLSYYETVESGIDTVLVPYINTASGLKVCFLESDSPDYSHACATTPATFDFILTDDSGLSATIEVDSTSGFAKRLN